MVLKDWVLIYPANLYKDSENLVENLKKASRAFGI
jgi:hypothetical protein